MAIRHLGGVVAGLLLALAVAPAAGEEDQRAGAGGDRMQILEKLLREGVDRFELGRQYEAKAALDKLLAETPTDEECWKLREVFGDRILRVMSSWMLEGRTLGSAPGEILKRAQWFEQSRRMEKQHIDTVVREAITNPEDPRPLYELSLLGPYAVPYLIEHLRSGKDDVARTNAAYILVHLGPQVVIPVAEALATNDNLLLEHLCDILRKIQPPDPRALPSLKRVHEDESLLPTVRNRWAKMALEAISGQSADNLKKAADFYYEEANRLYLSGPTVQEELEDLRGSWWVWAPDAANGKGSLEYIAVPSFALDDLMAEEMVYDAMALPGDKQRLQVLLASILMQAAKEVEEMSVILDHEGVVNPAIQAQREHVDLWRKRLYKNLRVSYTVGPVLLTRVLAKALMDGKGPVAVAAIEGIETLSRAKNGWAQTQNWNAPLAAAAPAASAAPGKNEATPAAVEITHPLLTALENPDRRVRYASAVALSHIGFPSDHPQYRALLPILVDGAREKSPIVCLIVSNNPQVRERLAMLLENKGVLAMTAPNGREACDLAVQFPPKDCIIIDSAAEEFPRLQQALAMKNITSTSPLPLTIITSREFVDAIARQFEKTRWVVQTRFEANPDNPRLYDDLRIAGRSQEGEKQVVMILTNKDRAARLRLREVLQLQAEKQSRPARQRELLLLMRQRNLLSDIFPLRHTFVNIFLDEELAGYNAMRTLQTLRSDVRTKHIPVALLTSAERRPTVEREFEKFLEKKEDARLMDYQIGDLDLLNEVKDMTALNPLSKHNYVRRMFDRIALRCAEALAALDIAGGAIQMAPPQVDGLREVLSDISRPVDLRTAVAKALGHFRPQAAAKTLAAVFREEDKRNIELRASCLDALGAIDTADEYREIKMAALDEPYIAIQEAAARALATVDSTDERREEVLVKQRVNDPRQILANGLKPSAAAEAAFAGGTTPPAASAGEEEGGGEEKGEQEKGENEAKEGDEKPAEDGKKNGGMDW